MSETLLRQEKGIVMVLLAVGLLAVMLAVAGLALDVGHGFIVKRQLQTAADAIALAGAGTAYPSTNFPDPSWDAAFSSAKGFIDKNRADGSKLEAADISYGWWNLATATWKSGSPVTFGTPPGIPQGVCTVSRASCFTNLDCPNDSCSMLEVPGVRVVISKSGEKNGGPVSTPFATVVGFNGFSPSSRVTVAVSGGPAFLGRNSVFPWAISKSMADQYSPNLSSNTMIDIKLFEVGNDLSKAGRWTSFFDQNNDVPGVAVSPNVTGSNPAPLTVGSRIHIAPGTRENLFNAIQPNSYVILPIVSSLIPSTDQPLLGVIGFYIERAVFSGSSWYLRGHFVAIEARAGGQAGGSYYGAHTPILVYVPPGQ